MKDTVAEQLGRQKRCLELLTNFQTNTSKQKAAAETQHDLLNFTQTLSIDDKCAKSLFGTSGLMPPPIREVSQMFFPTQRLQYEEKSIEVHKIRRQ